MLLDILESTETLCVFYCLMLQNICWLQILHLCILSYFVAHLLHNCAVTIKYYFEDIDQLIAKTKRAITKYKTRQAIFAAIGCPPQPVVTRKGSWLNAAFYYANNLLEVKAIVGSFEGYGILTASAKVSLQTTGLATQLLKSKNLYECVAELLETMESAKYTIKEVVQAIQEFDYEGDTYSINRYIKSSSYSVFIRCCSLSKDGRIHPIPSAIARTLSLHLL